MPDLVPVLIIAAIIVVVLIGLFVEVVSLVLAVVIWPVGVASIVGAVLIARGVREMHREKSAAQHHLHEHYKWKAIKEVW